MRPTVRVLEPSLPPRIVDEALTVLERTGVLIEDEHALKRLATVGLAPDAESGRVLFPRTGGREGARLGAVVDRAPRPRRRVRTRRSRATASTSCPRARRCACSTARTQEQREPTTADFVEYVKLADGLKNIDYLSTAFIPKDIPQDIADAWRLYLVLAHSKRPIVSGAFTAWGVPRMGELMAMFRSGKDELVKKPMAIFTCCPNTPLRWGEDPIANIMDCAEWGIPIEVVPVLLLGMISPTTTIGALVLHTAEVLSGLTIAQTVRPGHAGDLRRRAGVLPHAADDEPDDGGRGAAGLLRLRAGGEAPEAADPGLHGALGLEVQRPAGRDGDGRRRLPRRERRDQLGLRPRHARLRQLLQLREAGVRRRGGGARQALRAPGRGEGRPAGRGAPGRAGARQAPAHLGAHARALAGGALPAGADGRPHQLGPVERSRARATGARAPTR